MMISIVIPVYNAGDKLKKTIECIIDQKFKDYEVVLVDDGSTDQSKYICDEIVIKDSRFCVIHTENRGVSAARNTGMQLAKGDFISFLDADDIIPVDYFEVLNRIREKTRADVVCCDVVLISDGIEYQRFTHADAVINQKQALDLLLSRKKINSGPCAKLFRRSLIDSLAFPPLKVYEDILFVKDVFAKSDRIALTNQTEYQYIQNPNSSMQKFMKSPSFDVITASKELIDFILARKELDDGCLYATVSHLYQYVQPIVEQKDEASIQFITSVRDLYRRHWGSIWRCSAFPWKEKLYYTLFMLGVNMR